MLADNLGWGELGCYGGGMLRGAPTPAIDTLATQGLRLLNFNVESDCVPTRSALLTGRHPIRTGCVQSVPPGLPQGLSEDEVTLAELLSARGYRSAHFGKWHLGDVPGRYPSDRGFDEWFGIARTTDESQFTASLGFDPSVAPVPQVQQGRRGEATSDAGVYDLERRRRIDAELVERACRFIADQANARNPFFLYLPFIHLHFPTLPHPDFAGRTGAGDFADAMTELDHRVSQVLRALDNAGVAGETLVIFCSDNGPEFRAPWRGTAGPWRGTYHTAMEGSLRVPCIIRWPGRVAAGRVSNEVVHVCDLFSSLAHIGGADLPTDRPIDGVDQTDFFTGRRERSAREGFVYFIRDELRAVKWRDWKLHFWWEPEVNHGRGKLESPLLFNLTRDPKEEIDVLATNTWVMGPMLRLAAEFQASCHR